jgi:hypothetical protein
MEFFIDLLPKEKWRPVFHQDKDLLIAASVWLKLGTV